MVSSSCAATGLRGVVAAGPAASPDARRRSRSVPPARGTPSPMRGWSRRRRSRSPQGGAARRQPRLGEEAAPRLRARRPGQLRVQHLQRHRQVEPLVAHQIHRRRRSAPELADEAEACRADSFRAASVASDGSLGPRAWYGRSARVSPRFDIVDVVDQDPLPPHLRRRQGALRSSSRGLGGSWRGRPGRGRAAASRAQDRAGRRAFIGCGAAVRGASSGWGRPRRADQVALQQPGRRQVAGALRLIRLAERVRPGGGGAHRHGTSIVTSSPRSMRSPWSRSIRAAAR